MRVRARALRVLAKYQKKVFFLLKKSIQPLKNWIFGRKKLYFYTQKYLPAPQKTEVLHEKLKNVLQYGILKFIFFTPNFTKFLNP